MKVKDALLSLSHCNPEAELVMAKDGEGNDYSPLAQIDVGKYDARSTWAGDFYGIGIIGDDEYAQPSGAAIEAVCLWPTN